MKWIANRHDAVARMGWLISNRSDLLERVRCLKQSQIVRFIGRNEAQFDLGLATQVALNIANTTIDYMLIGNNMSAIANHEASTGFIYGFGWILRRGTRFWRSRDYRFCNCWLWRGNCELTSISYPIFLDGGDAIGQRRQELRSLSQAKLKQLTLRKDSHNLRFSELGNKRGICRHLNVYKL